MSGAGGGGQWPEEGTAQGQSCRARLPAPDLRASRPYLQADFLRLLLLAVEGGHPPEDLQDLCRLARLDHPAYGLRYPPAGQGQAAVAQPRAASPFERLGEEVQPGPRGRRPGNLSRLTTDFTEFKLGQALHLGCLQPAQLPLFSSPPSRRAFARPPPRAACYRWVSS